MAVFHRIGYLPGGERGLRVTVMRVAVGAGSAAGAFLGTQGDPWDIQEDMATAAVGALTALLFFSRWHDGLIGRMETKKAALQAAGDLGC